MRYTPEHKQATRETVVAVASREFRRRGFAGVGIAKLMAEAGLTHGGFYAHFPAKEALVAESLEFALQESFEALRSAAERGGLESIVALYLSEGHRDHPAKGCPLPSLSAEVGRGSKASRVAFSQTLDSLLGLVADALPEDRPELRRERAAFTLAAMVGAILLARATAGTSQSQGFLEGTKKCLAAAFPKGG